MKDIHPLKRHYLLLFPVLILLTLSGLLLSLNSAYLSFFILGFLWPWVLTTPELKEKIRTPRYRFSFFRLIFWIEKVVDDQLFFEIKISLKPVSRMFGPLLFSFLFSIMTGFGIFLCTLLGLILSEGWLFINKKYYPDSFQKNKPNLSENSL